MHADMLFKQSGKKIDFPKQSRTWEEIKERVKNAISIPEEGL